MPGAEHESHNADPTKTSSSRTLARPARFGQSGTGITHPILIRLAWPYIELLMRWWLAKVFILHGLAGVMDFQGALEAARFEYPGHFSSSAAAIYAGTWIELLAGVMNWLWAYVRFGGGMTERPGKLALARSRCIGLKPNR